MKTFIKVLLRCVQLIVSIILTSNASAQLKANFTATPKSGCPPMVVAFSDSSTGSPTSWKWDLGNGTISFIKDPVATYFNAGTYNIKLVVKNAFGADSITKSQFLTVNAVPVVNFGASDSTGCFPLKVNFFDSSTAGSGTIASWQWDFGDGVLSNLKNPIHTYTAAGSYNVTLRVVNSNGCSKVLTKKAFVRLLNGVTANFSYASKQGCHSPAPITFTNHSTGTGLLNYLWDFGDGNTSSQANPVHNYLNAGSFTVKLIVKNSFGCADTMVKSNAVLIGFVNADFNKPDTVCAGATFTINNTSTPGTIGAVWNFGDGSTSTAINPVKVYATAGTFKIKLINDFGACLDSVTKQIVVLPKPAAGFTATNNVGCKAPLNVSFTNTSVGGVSFAWNFGDGATSTGTNPNHTYTQLGEYTITLVATNAAGCTDTIVKTNFVKIVPPQVFAIQNLAVRGCVPYTISPKASVQSNTPITSYFWDFGDGTTSTSSAPNHTYTIPGSYTVKITIETASGCKDSLTMSDAVKVGRKPVAQFTATPLDACAFKPVNFSDLTTNGPIHEWYWNFGDGGTSIEQNPIYSYNDTGKFTVSLIVFNFGCSDTIKKIDYIHIKPPIAAFDTTFTCADRLTRGFVDKSVGALAWNWNFGDGNTSTATNPSHTYATPGTYSVELKVSNGTCEHTSRRNVQVIKEVGRLEISDSIKCQNSRVTFNVASVNSANILNYTWFFDSVAGAPIVTTNNPVANSYNKAGIFKPAVVIQDLLSCKDTIKSVLPITIFGPKANFFSHVEGTCFGNMVNFPDSSISDGVHPITSWTWNYGNGAPQTYTSGPFSHLYDTTGTYNVSLVIKDTYGCTDSIMKLKIVTITKPKAIIVPSDTLLCPSSTLWFTNNSDGYKANYFWDFGDGTTSIDFSPVHTYSTEGVYKVKMLMVDKYGCRDSAYTSIRVFKAVADLLMSDSFSTCPPLVVNFTNKSTNYVEILWDFGDGSSSTLSNPSHIYTYPGTFTVRLQVKNNGGCTSVISKKVVILGPTGVFTYSPNQFCKPLSVSFSANTINTVKYIWDFNDGNTIFNTSPSTTHLYALAGNYIPKLIVEDASGCRVPILGKDTIKVYGIETSIQATNKVVCDSGMVTFTESTISNDVISNYKWEFGDGTTSTVRNPSHNYTTTGHYNVTLIAKSSFGCSDTAIYTDLVKVVNAPQIRILGDTFACEPGLINFKSGLVRADTSTISWNWTFGNGQVSTLQTPVTQTYPSAGTYPVKLTATNTEGCKDTTDRTVVIHPKPIVYAGMDTAMCRFSSVQLNAAGANTFTWSVNPNLSCLNCASPIAKPDTSTMYYVLGKTSFGCTNTDSVLVKVQSRMEIDIVSADTLCAGQSVSLKVSGADKYEWSPSLWLDNPNSATPKATPDTTIRYRVIGSDSGSCFADTVFITLKVYPIPRVLIKIGDRVNLTTGGTVKLETQNSTDVTTWSWSPIMGLSCASCAEPIASPRETVTYTVVATNDGTCIARDQVTVTMICNDGNIFIPNTFSPNADGSNDLFYPRGKGISQVKTMKIFNRWGQIVFEKNNFTPNLANDGWNGTSNGEKLPPDVFVYIIEVVCDNQTIIPLKGNISLVR